MQKTIVVWFSCGAASAIAAKLTVDQYGKTHNVLIVNNPVDEEDDDNKRFKDDVSKWLSYPILEAKNTKIGTTSAMVVWDRSKYMSGVKGAPCTKKLKKEVRYEFELTHDIDFHVLGFTVNEKGRHDRFVKIERANLLPVLIDAGITKNDCFTILTNAGIKLPDAYLFGFPNANCKGCVKSTSPTYWNHVRKIYTDVFKQRAEQSRRLKCKLVRYKGKRIYLDELPEDAKGNKMKGVECGIFCDTK